MKDTIINFFSNLVSVVLGIVITFSVQGMIDRAQGRKDVRSGLELVRTELTANLEDIRTMCSYLEDERASARYLLSNRMRLERCPADSVDYCSGVLFADEFCEAPKSTLEALRGPLEDRKVIISRLKAKVVYPASFMLVAAANPCPCGYYGEGDRCTCTPGARANYLLVFRELVQHADGTLGTKWVPEIAPPSPPASVVPGKSRNSVSAGWKAFLPMPKWGRGISGFSVRFPRSANSFWNGSSANWGSAPGPIPASSKSPGPSPTWPPSRTSFPPTSPKPPATASWTAGMYSICKMIEKILSLP